MRAGRHPSRTGAERTAPADLRGVPALWPLRGRRAAVVVCRDAPEDYEAARGRFLGLGAELLVERRPGPLSRALGRPAVVVCDRYLDVVAADPELTPGAALGALAWADARCEECPQAAEELPGLAAAWRGDA